MLPNEFNYYNFLFFKLRSKSGTNNKGTIVLKSKSNKRTMNTILLFDERRIWSTNLSLICKIKLNINLQIIGLLKFSNGSISLVKVPYGSFIGSFFKTTILPLKFIKASLIGFRVFIGSLMQNMIFFDLGLFNLNSKFIKANGTFGQILSNLLDLKLVLVILPSGKKKYVSLNYICTLGRNNNIFSKFLIIGGAGWNRLHGKNVTVRGVAMNPVDHPHGGRTKTNKPEVSPWGWVTKHSH